MLEKVETPLLEVIRPAVVDCHGMDLARREIRSYGFVMESADASLLRDIFFAESRILTVLDFFPCPFALSGRTPLCISERKRRGSRKM